MAIVLANVDHIKTSSGQTLDVNAAVASASSGGSGASANFVATGNITAGQTVGLSADGTVEIISGIQHTQTETLGTEISFTNTTGNISYITSVFDSNSNKVVIAYQDGGNSDYGTAVVGEVSGNSISFGSPVVFANSSLDTITSVFDSNSNKVVIAFRDNGNSSHGTAVVGEVSGNSISFGSPVVFANSNALNISLVFEPNEKKAVFLYRDYSANSAGIAKVGTVSGNSITFSTANSFKSSDCFGIRACYDTNQKRIVVLYNNNNAIGTAVVAEVNGNVITFGNPVVFHSGTLYSMSAVYEPLQKKMVISFVDEDFGVNYGTAIVSEVSGNSITFGSKVRYDNSNTSNPICSFDSWTRMVIFLFASSSAAGKPYVISGMVDQGSITFNTRTELRSTGVSYPFIIFDSSQNKSVITYLPHGESGKSFVYFPTSDVVSTNANSWLGIAGESIASGNSGSVNLMGSVDSNQSGLTVGKIYYVNYDGTLTDTPNEGVENGTYGKIGKALSATSLLLTK